MGKITIKVLERYIVCCIFILHSVQCLANEKDAIATVKSFAQILSEYNISKDLGVCGPKFEQIFDGNVKCRVEDDLMQWMVEKNPMLPQSDGTYILDTYLNEITKNIDDGISISIENIVYDASAKNNVIGGTADCVKYDVCVRNGYSINARYSNLAFVRNGHITGIYQYLGARNYDRAIKMLLPTVNSLDEIYGHQRIDLLKAKDAFQIFRNIAANSYGAIATESMGFVVAMELAGIGGGELCKEAFKRDLANYFCMHTTCPKIEKVSKGDWQITGLQNYGSFTGSGENTENMKFYKNHPYLNGKGSTYFHFISPFYRSMGITEVPFVVKKGKLFGFMSQKGEQTTPCQYSFAYPFDQRYKIAIVQNTNGKWGGIDTQGNTVIPFEYDVANDVFVNGKNAVIKDRCLVFIDTKGNKLRQLSGYIYLIPKLAENQIIAYNAIDKQYDAFDFNGNLICKDCFPEEYTKIGQRPDIKSWPKNKYIYLWYYYFRFNGHNYDVQDDVNNADEVLKLRIDRRYEKKKQ